MLGRGQAAPWLALCAVLAFACSRSDAAAPAEGAAPPAEGAAKGAARAAGQPVVPPFPVQGELEGLLIVWFDAEGAHTAQRRSDIPEAHRKAVRIASLRAIPGSPPDPDHVYVADLSQPRADGSYPVTRHRREWFEAQVEAARGRVELAAAAPSNDVTLYSASWCGACKSAAAYMRSRDVPFAEKDVEKDPQASDEMLRKARAAGKEPRGVPVIDFRGHIVLGFNQHELDRLIDQAKGQTKTL